MKPPFVLQVRLIGLGLFAVGLVLPPPATAAEDPLVGEWPGYTRAFEAPVAFHANYIYVGGLMHIFDVSIPFNPIRLGGIGSASGRDVVFAGNYAYLAAGGDGLKIYDVSNPLLPAPVATLDTPGSAQGIAVSGNHVYLADYEGGFRIFNVANPASPSLVGSLPVISLANDVVVSGNFAFVADELDGFRVVNISNPAAPVLVTTLSTKTGYSYRAVLS
ncbi:MAG TPA: hypothetical protein VJW76_00535, partial [Verrucomicrobiae bacterium]|nr:hypothetical protein [Verrucomicrobiae bacterium]